MRTRTRIDNLIREIRRLEDRIWALENPPKFKRGDGVHCTYYDPRGKHEYDGVVADIAWVMAGSRRYNIIPDDNNMPMATADEREMVHYCCEKK